MFPTVGRPHGVGAIGDPLEQRLNRMMRLFGEEPKALAEQAVYPVDIWEDEQSVHVEAELPGFKADEVQISVEDNMLTISAEREEERHEGEKLRERQYASYRRSFTLPTSIQTEGGEAHLENGVLELTLPKSPESRPHRIEVK